MIIIYSKSAEKDNVRWGVQTFALIRLGKDISSDNLQKIQENDTIPQVNEDIFDLLGALLLDEVRVHPPGEGPFLDRETIFLSFLH